VHAGINGAELTAKGLADKVRVELWPGADIAGRVSPGQALPATGEYRVRIQVSGLRPKGDRAPHLTFYAVDLDRMLFETDVETPEDKPVVVEFTAHLPAGNQQYRLTNDVPGPPNTPTSSRALRTSSLAIDEPTIFSVLNAAPQTLSSASGAGARSGAGIVPVKPPSGETGSKGIRVQPQDWGLRRRECRDC
jgi:hypothetical protein